MNKVFIHRLSIVAVVICIGCSRPGSVRSIVDLFDVEVTVLEDYLAEHKAVPSQTDFQREVDRATADSTWTRGYAVRFRFTNDGYMLAGKRYREAIFEVVNKETGKIQHEMAASVEYPVPDGWSPKAS